MSLDDYKSYVDDTLETISNKIKSKISLLILSELDLSDPKLQYLDFHYDVQKILIEVEKSEDVKKFISDTESKLQMLSPQDKELATDYRKQQITHFISSNVHEHSISTLKEKAFQSNLEKIRKNPSRPSKSHRSYDHIVKGDCTIKKIKNNKNYSHKITLYNTGSFLEYQVYHQKGVVPITHMPVYPNNTNHPTSFADAKRYIEENAENVITVNHEINNDRDVNLINGKEWVKYFNDIIGFTPTTVMEINYDKYVFVIKKTKINKNNKVVFYISTKEIQTDTKLKKMTKIPTGKKYKNVRFDIDYGQGITGEACNGGGTISGISTCYCPAGSHITTMGANWIDLCINDCASGWTDVAGVCWGSTYYGCQSGCSNVLGCCWDGWIACRHPNCSGPKVESYIPSSFVWIASDGYYCNNYGYNFSNSYKDDLGKVLTRDGPCGERKPACWNASNSDKYCCVEEGKEMCCPPGSNCG